MGFPSPAQNFLNPCADDILLDYSGVRCGMDLGQERLNMLVQVMGKVVMELSLLDACVNADTIADRLDRYRRGAANIKDKRIYRDAAEIVRCGSRSIVGR